MGAVGTSSGRFSWKFGSSCVLSTVRSVSRIKQFAQSIIRLPETRVETNINIFQDGERGFCLTVMDADDQTHALFENMELQGGGYTWEGIVTALVEINMPQALPSVRIGAEADNMYAYCQDRSILERLAKLIRNACADHKLLSAAIEHAGENLE